MFLMDIETLFPSESYRFDDSGNSPALFWRGGPFILTAAICDNLVTAGRLLGHKNLRICLHESRDAYLQDMVVLTWRGKDIPPHYHPSKTECLHIIRGQMRVHFYDEAGNLMNSCELDPEEKPFINSPPATCHENQVISEYGLFHEIKIGLSDGDEANIIPAWARE